MCAGTSIITCRATRRHVLAFEEDRAIFDALIRPVIRTNAVPPAAVIGLVVAAVDLDEEDVQAQPIVKTSFFSK